MRNGLVLFTSGRGITPAELARAGEERGFDTIYAFLAVLLLRRRERTSVRSVLLPALGIGALTPLVSAPGQLPATLLQSAPSLPDAVSVVLMVLLLVAAGLVTLREALRVSRGPVVAGYAVVQAGVYLVVLAGLWLAALPQTFDGGPLVGSLPYVVACFGVCGGLVWVTARSPAARVSDAKVAI